ncbi:MAG: hypothetical protein U1F57_11270 [bacterium]
METGFLKEEDQRELLRIAREVIESHLRREDTRPIRSLLPNLRHAVGAFVACISKMLKVRRPSLFGQALFETVREVAIAAATQISVSSVKKHLEEEMREVDIRDPGALPFAK